MISQSLRRYQFLASLRNHRGFSTLELLVALGLLVVTVGVSYEFLVTGSQTAVTIRNSMFSQQQVQAGIDNMTDEIRWGDSITAASGTSVTVHIPANTPFSAGPYSVTFAYNATGHTITRQQDTNPSATIAYNIIRPDLTNGFSIDYYDNSSNPLGQTPPDLLAVTRMRITVVATNRTSYRLLAGDVTLREH